MKRYIAFIIIYILSTVGYLISISQSWADGIYFFIYLVSSLLFVFELGRLPDKEDMKYPEVVKYRAKRVNYFTYIVLASLVAQAILYSILNISLKLSGGLIVFILWGLSIVIIYLASIINEKLNKNAEIMDYIFQDSNVPFDELSILLDEFDKGKQNLEKITIRYPQLKKTFLYESYNRYEELKKSSNSLTYKEIESLKNSKL